MLLFLVEITIRSSQWLLVHVKVLWGHHMQYGRSARGYSTCHSSLAVSGGFARSFALAANRLQVTWRQTSLHSYLLEIYLHLMTKSKLNYDLKSKFVHNI